MRPPVKLYIILLLACVSCSKSKIKIWTESPTIYHPDLGMIDTYPIQKGQPYIISYFRLGTLEYCMAQLPKGKIDSIMRKNPGWNYIIYGQKCSVADTAAIGEALRRIDCHIPVILDSDGVFEKLNGLEGVAAIGYICDKDGYVQGGGVIGFEMFDRDFRYVKIQMGLPLD